MFKKIMVMALVILSFCTGLAIADRPIRIVVNGHQEVYSSVPPQIIDGHVMVPIGSIAKALDKDVGWDADTQTVTVDDKNALGDISQPPVIHGPVQFVDIIQGSLDLLKQKDIMDYNRIRLSLKSINYQIDPTLTVAAYTNLETNECFFKGDYFDKFVNDVSHNDAIMILTGVLSHEATHVYFQTGGKIPLPGGVEDIFTPNDIEGLCDIAGLRTIEKIGGDKSSIAYKEFAQRIRRDLFF